MRLNNLTFKSRIIIFSITTLMITLFLMLYTTHSFFKERLKNDLEGHLQALSDYIVKEKLYLLKNDKLKYELQSNKRLFFLSDKNILELLNIEISVKNKDQKADNVFVETKLSDKKWMMLYVSEELLDPDNQMIRKLAAVLFIILLLSTLIIVWRIRFLLEPINSLIHLCNDVREKSNSITICNPYNKELLELKYAITSLMDTNRNLCESKVDIFKEAAHELKSPLAVMQARLTLLQDAKSYDLDKYIDETNDDIAFLSSKLNELLFLKEIEWDMEQEYVEEISMKEQCELMRNRFKRMLELKGIWVEIDWSKSFIVKAHLKVVQKVMQAVYENVFLHAKPQSEIYVKTFPSIKKIVISNEIDNSQTNHNSSHIGLKIIKRLSSQLGYEFFIEKTQKYFITTIKFV